MYNIYIYTVCVTHIHPVLSSIIPIECCCSTTVRRSSSRGATDPDLAFQHPPNPGSSVTNCIRSSVETPWPDVPNIQGRKGRLTLISCFFQDDFLGWCSLIFRLSPWMTKEIGMIFQKWNCFGIMCPIVCWTSVLFSRANRWQKGHLCTWFIMVPSPYILSLSLGMTAELNNPKVWGHLRVHHIARHT